MTHRILLIFGLLSLQGCSYAIEMAFYNNTDNEITICNLNLKKPTCQTVAAQSLINVTLVGDIYSPQLNFNIGALNQERMYSFNVEYPEQASEVYCKTHFITAKVCDIPVQYEPSGNLYWAGEKFELPVSDFPDQPSGFPVVPIDELST
ncbi:MULTISPECIES: hypothetical protein [Vibrio]|uniref:Lipoprotein n=1 Tax=Vibrio cortegadensis TaxID=1328770 RepID=A0ABV4MBU7_9VIBR|nr:hypothetical protein [Vibrio genomosp. F6]TKF24965.1 hypothetical protein FCV43_00010 [Vibrio genomosp. F6]